MDTVFEPVCIGLTCETKFQVSRNLYFRRYPTRSEAAFRLTLMGPTLGSHMFGWGLLDWQMTPMEAAIAYLERDFQGVFEREDLIIVNNEVVHRDLGTNHIHEFEHIRRDGIVTDAMVDEGYPGVRKKFEKLVDRFRQHLEAPGDYLYVSSEIRPEPQLRRLLDLLEARSPAHRARLLVVPYDDQDEDISAIADRVTKAHRPRTVDKGPTMAWEGDDAAWDAALNRFNLELSSMAPSAKPAAEPAEDSAAPRGLLSRLFHR